VILSPSVNLVRGSRLAARVGISRAVAAVVVDSVVDWAITVPVVPV
jgi:hypothetical protein